MSSNGDAQTNLTLAEGVERDPVWWPDGSQIAFVSDRDGNSGICVMKVNGDDQTNLTPGEGTDSVPASRPGTEAIQARQERIAAG